MKYLIITGGDNCYCGRSNSICDRNVILVDTKEKTLRYVSGDICLCKYCFYPHELSISKDEAWYLFRDEIYGGKRIRYKYYAENVTNSKMGELHSENAKTMKVIVKGNKWGKDSEFGKFGFTFGSTWEQDATEIELTKFRDGKETEYWENFDTRSEKPKDYWFEKTGWKLIR